MYSYVNVLVFYCFNKIFPISYICFIFWDSCWNTAVTTQLFRQLIALNCLEAVVFTQLYCNSCLNKAFQRLLVENSLF